MASTIFSPNTQRGTLGKWIRSTIFFATIAGISATVAPAHADNHRTPIVAGWVELVRINPGNLLVKAKLDTGARTSSMDAPHFEEFEKDGEKWVRFGFSTNERRSVMIERPVKRVARIRDLNGPDQIRNVIEIGICLGDTYAVTEVTLFDRTGFNYRLLLGRSFLKKAGIVVDPDATHITKPRCPVVVTP